MQKRMQRKLKSERGESIAETLYSTLVISLAFLILAGGIIAAATINAKVKNKDYSLDVEGTSSDTALGTGSVTVKGESAAENYTVGNIPFYETGHGYIYYEK